ncbi:MAG TPA: aldehyde dehydrogenase family protein, partial [Dongiaceae bacterium]
MSINKLLKQLGLDPKALSGGDLIARSPIDGSVMAKIQTDSKAAAEKKIARADEAFKAWRAVPAPQRGELVRLFGDELRAHKAELGALVSHEVGKIVQEGLGE